MIFDKLKYRWHLLPINRQLIVLVTASLLGFVVVFLTVDHGLRTERILSEKQSVLTNEAKTLYEGLRVVEHHGDAAIHDFIDNVANGMNATESARHHILAHWNGRRYESLPHKMPAGSTSVSWNIELDLGANHSIVRDNEIIGAFKGPLGSVYVLEHRDSVLNATHYSLLSQTVGVITLGAIAAIAASIVLRQLVAKPIQRLVSTLQGVGAGDLSVVARTRSCQELRYLAEQINIMTRSLEHAQRDHRLHMEKARQIQQNLRPSLTELAGVDVAELFQPADDVGGDYYDVIHLSGDRILLCVADVAGHGVPAAMAATLLKAFVSEAAKQSASPATILIEVNQRYCEYVMMGHFATMCLVVIDTANQSLTYASAGHESPIVQVDSAKPTRLEAGDLPLGVEETTIYGEETVEVRGRTRIVIVSDGVSESFNPFDEQFGTERIEEIISQQTENSAADVVQDLRASLESFRAGCQRFDDTTLLVAQFTGANDVPENGDSLSEHKRTIGCRTYRKTQSIAS
ncbi:PP2C family protein-serine/threonine phosphatase [Roseimaritima ulvae]|uniref:Phosphoserine phosphatase RsbU n=1 Tax=Roseimaritima ulvae TaxID=980254 RepID=A0A5B9QU63_9BACT|nr:SpoIIE family protein phosphatase [Roseimaritima ulvae]QEG41300.1 Phosphoserine phosphatase RsbU [Roseimaritima ulvae]